MTTAITLSSASLPVFITALTSLSSCLAKAKTNAESRNFNPDVFVTMRLAPDMLPFASQIRIACDVAKNASARLAGIQAPRFEDNETRFEELEERVLKTIAWIKTVDSSLINGREQAEITFPAGKDSFRTLDGETYLKHWAIPNLFFHVSIAYALMRQAGVDLGKRDYLGDVAR